ncbi:MAG: tRNA (adenosine(37)-N6)-threonylcarbamoyltransferase complex ATPase subunit type 1 TsaE [Phycisphaerales bacterium]|nr:MAG: tRNA (adenosine(37)-N6)-threonylcarbamoyltransferase complex ATPase subunit type 1 TsaE [Phycisphaerales bacterium]
MTIERTVHNEEETIALGAALGARLRAGDVLALSGELGAGKTRFVRGVAQGMGINPARVHSPTFVLVNEYTPTTDGAPPLIHIDAYRLHSADDLDALGWDRIADGSSVIAIEWVERIADALPPAALRVAIEHAAESERRIVLAWDAPSWRERLEGLACTR